MPGLCRDAGSERDVINIAFTVMPQCGAMRGSKAATGDRLPALILIVDDDPIQRRLARGYGQTIWLQRRDCGIGRKQRSRVSRRAIDPADQSPDPRSRHARSRRHGSSGRECASAISPSPRSSRRRMARSKPSSPPCVRARRTSSSSRSAPSGYHVSIKNALRVDALEDELRRATRRNAGELRVSATSSPARNSMARTVRLAERAAKSTIPVLIGRRVRRRQGIDGARDPGRAPTDAASHSSS